jgi:metal-responsive CopG/Arc/MetJ family transcriptional regulator
MRPHRHRKTATLSVTIGIREMEMLKEVVERCGFISLSEAVRDMIRRYYEAASQKCGDRRPAASSSPSVKENAYNELNARLHEEQPGG